MSKPRVTVTKREKPQYRHMGKGGTRRVVESLSVDVATDDAGACTLTFELRLVEKTSKAGRRVLCGPYWYAAMREPAARGTSSRYRRTLWVYVGRVFDVRKAVVRLAGKADGQGGRQVV